jgi:hypothetical protein
MQLAYQVLVLFHLIAFAALFGGVLVQARSRESEINASMLHGSFTLLVTGLALVALVEIGPDPVNHIKIGIKLVIAAVIVVLVAMNRKFASIPRGLWGLIGALTIANAAVAVLWQ